MVGSFVIYTEYRSASRRIDRYETRTYTEKKRMLESEVYQAINVIKNEQMDIRQVLMNKLKERVYHAHKQAAHLYQKYHGKVTDSRLKEMIIESLRPARFFNGRGYYFIVTLEGKELLYPIRPQLEGNNLMDLQDKRGKYVIKEEIATVRKKGEGFVEAHWPAPSISDTTISLKTSFVKHFAPFDWYIGCGDYHKSLVKDAKKKALKKLSDIRYGKGNYIFVNTYDGKALNIHSKEYTKGDDISEMTDPDGVKIFERELEAARKPGGGFVNYKWYEPKDYRYVKALAFVNGFDDWGWIVGTWLDIQRIEEDIAYKKQEIRNNMMERVAIVLIILLAAYAFIFFYMRKIRSKIRGNFNYFTKQLDEALNNNKLINGSNFRFEEFRTLTTATNKIISERDRAVKKLAQSEAELKTIFQHAPMIIAGVNPDGSFEIYNDYVEKTLGYTGLELKNFENALKIIIKNDEERARALTNFKRKPGEFSEYHVSAKDGTEHIQYWASFRLFDEKTILFGYDLTELKEAQARLKQREKELKELNATKDKFFSIIAHDLKNPLNALNGFASLLKEEYDDYEEEERKDIIKNIIISSENMSKLLENLLEWSRSQMGRLSFHPESFNPENTIQENISLLSSQAAKKQIRLHYEPAGEIGEIYADKKMVDTVLRNLLSNALKFTYPGGKVVVSTYSKDSMCFIEVADNGTGMTEEETEKVFDVGEKTKKSGTSNEKGTGLGLILVKEFVEKNTGTLHVDSEPEKGTTFTFSLPLTDNTGKFTTN